MTQHRPFIKIPIRCRPKRRTATLLESLFRALSSCCGPVRQKPRVFPLDERVGLSDYRGSVLVAGQEVADADIAHLAGTVAMVMQDPDSQVVTTRVLDEVCYALENLRVPADRIEPRAMSALEAVGMGRFARASPWELSGGQRQRAERSEERRVGKECRSRWSPYH